MAGRSTLSSGELVLGRFSLSLSLFLSYRRDLVYFVYTFLSDCLNKDQKSVKS